MPEEKKITKTVHNLILKERKTLDISGVLDVDSFNDNLVVAYTELGELTIKGEKLHINKINLDTGDLSLDGDIYGLEYSENHASDQGFFSRLFR